MKRHIICIHSSVGSRYINMEYINYINTIDTPDGKLVRTVEIYLNGSAEPVKLYDDEAQTFLNDYDRWAFGK